MKRFILTFLLFILVIALTIVTTILLVNYNASNGRLAILETKLTNFEMILGDLDTEPVDGSPITLPDFSKFVTEDCSNANEEGSLLILFPCNGSTVQEEFSVFGIAKGFYENNISLRVTVGGRVVSNEGLAYPSSEIGEAGILSAAVDLSSLSRGDIATLRFFEQSPMDGEEVKVVEFDVEIE